MINKRKQNKNWNIKFWDKSKDGKIRIKHLDLINFLEHKGYVKIKQGNQYVIGKIDDNVIYSDCSIEEIVDVVRNHLQQLGEQDVLEVFSRGISNYISGPKLRLLNTVHYELQRDTKDESWIIFRNTAVRIRKNSVDLIPHDKVPFLIPSSNIIDREFNLSKGKLSDFHAFMLNISGKDLTRMESPISTIGYLMHRYQDPSVRKVTVFSDKHKSADGKTNGRTGKSLLIKALRYVREVERFNGKNFKEQSVFQLQRLKRTTDIMAIDDLRSGVSIESFYNFITDEICVEKKGKDEFCIDPENTPKIVVSSNFYLKGPGGSSDRDRRNEFELDDYYNDKHKPVHDFGKEFFSGWDVNDWNKFYSLMILCLQIYLQKGLKIADPINLIQKKLVQSTSAEFADYVQKISMNKWLIKSEVLEGFNNSYPDSPDISSNKFTRFLKEYAAQSNLEYQDKSSGGKFEFILKTINAGGDGKEG